MLLPQTTRGVTGIGTSRHADLVPTQASPAGSKAALILPKLAVGIVTLAAWTAPLQAGPIAIPNGSFESPATDFAYPLIDSWQQVPANTFQSGVFSNQSPVDPTHIDNCEGPQGAFLFASNQVAILQDYGSTDWMNPTPTHAFNATFDVGKSYTLTVGVIGGTNLSIPMQEGTRLEISLYYRDSASNLVTVAATSITNSGAIFSNATHFIDFQVRVPTVRASDAWAGHHIGVRLLSSVSPALEGGYWDLDNVRLVAEPFFLDPARISGQLTFALQSEPGLRFEILGTTNLSLALSNWTVLGTVTNVTGTVPFLDPDASLHHRFYQARQLP